MKLDVIEKKENPFLKRIDIMLMVDHKGQSTPKREDLEKSIAQEFKSVPEKVEIVYIFSGAGLAKSKIKARVWKEKIVEKKKPKEKKIEKEETKPEEVKEEKPAEKKPEEKPKETPKKEIEKEPKKEQPKPEEKKGEKK